MNRRESRSGAQTVERAVLLLKEVAAADAAGVTLARLVRQTALNRTTVYRLVRCLVAERLLRQDTAAKRYLLGSLARELGSLARRHVDVRALLAPVLSRIAAESGDTVFLLLRSGYASVCADRRLGSYPVKTLVVDVGTRRPLGVGVAGIAMLGALPEHELRSVVEHNAAEFRSFGLTAPSVLRAARAAKQLGHAQGPVNRVKGVFAVGVPVLGAHDAPIGAIAIAAIDERMRPARRAQLVTLARQGLAKCRELLADLDAADE